MSVAKISKITLIFPSRNYTETAALLCAMECVEIISGSEGARAMSPAERKKRLDEVSSSFDEVRRAVEIIGKTPPAVSPPPSAAAQENLETSYDWRRVSLLADFLSKSIAQAEHAAARFAAESARLLPWVAVDVPLSKLADGSLVKIYAGQVASPRWYEFLKALSVCCANHAEKISDDGKTVSFGLAYPARLADKISETLKKFGCAAVAYPYSDETPADMLARLDRMASALARRIERRRRALAGLAPELPRLKSLADRFLRIKTSLEAEKLMSATERNRFFSGWIISSRIPELEQALRAREIPHHFVVEKPAPGDDVPIVLENKKPVRPFEVITDLYGKPNYAETDPTPWLAPFFALFFGICMADALYGLIIVSAGVAGLAAFKTPSARKFMKLVLYCGAATILFGAATGSYFGNLIDRFGLFASARPLKNKLVLFDPLKNSIEFLGACLALGLIQTLLGSSLKLVAEIRNRCWREVFLGAIPVIGIQLLFPALILVELFGVRLAPSSWLLAALAASSVAIMINQWIINDGVVLKLFQMFFSVYGAITGNALSDVLSYSRLFALGLSTALLAMVLNEVAALLFAIPYVGIVAGTAIILAAHPFILAIGSLGAYVHTSRLQYLEFFNKFFQGGGREMKPLRWENKYTA